MRFTDESGRLGARICAQLTMRVAPEAAAGVARAYPVGAPVLTPVCSDPCALMPHDTARYVLRQPFVAEIPISVRAGVRTSRPGVRMRGASVGPRL